MMWLRRLAWFVLAVLVLMGAAWLGLPGALKPHGGQRLSALLGRAASIERVKRKPWLLMLTVRQLQFAGLGKSATPLLRAERPYVNADARSLIRIAPVIEAREVDAPQVHVSRLAASRCDIDDVFTRLQLQSKKTQPSEPLKFALYNMPRKDGALTLADRAVACRRRWLGELWQVRGCRCAA